MQHSDINIAADELITQLAGLSNYIAHNGFKVFAGLTGGTDSRGIYAALNRHNPVLFTWIRSKFGDQKSSPDSDTAKELASKYNHDINIFQLRTPKLNDVTNQVAVAFREATSNYRGPTSMWLNKCLDLNNNYTGTRFVRGFGGEILRGFYQENLHKLKSASSSEMSAAYDINSGSMWSKKSFEEFCETTSFSDDRMMGRDPNDLFYWEHRMGTWGSVSMSEADIAVKSISGYNCRRLFEKFLGLDYGQRKSREATSALVKRISPELYDVPLI